MIPRAAFHNGDGMSRHLPPRPERNIIVQEPVFVWPSHSPVTLLITLLVLLGLLLVAYVVARIRGVGSMRRRLEQEVLYIRDLAREKGLHEEERRLIEDLVRRRSPNDPMRVVTERRWFNRCVAAKMSSLVRQVSGDEFAGRGAALRSIRRRFTLDYVSPGQPLETSRDLQAGQLIWVSPARETDWLRTRLVHLDEAYLQLQILNSDQPLSLQSGTRMRCRLGRLDDARYVFESNVAEFHQDPKALHLMHSTSMKRIQTRAHFRIRFRQIVTVGIVGVDAVLDGGGASRTPESTTLRGNITSLSAGGVAVVAQQDLPLGIGMRFRLSLPGYDPWDVMAKVVSTSPLSGGRSLIRGAFVGVGDGIREAIANHVMREQRQAVRQESA